MLMAIDEEHHEEGDKDGMKMYLEDKTKIDSGPLTWWQKMRSGIPSLLELLSSCTPSFPHLIHPSTFSQRPGSL